MHTASLLALRLHQMPEMQNYAHSVAASKTCPSDAVEVKIMALPPHILAEGRLPYQPHGVGASCVLS